MKNNRCAASYNCNSNRRDFLKKSALVAAGSVFMGNFASFALERNYILPRIQSYGKARKYVPRIEVAFVRRKEEYGMWWPGAIYNGDEALKMYTEKLESYSGESNVDLDIRNQPLYSLEETDRWLAEAKASEADGLILMTLDRQKHSWPSAKKASESGIPAVIFSPLGTSFTTNTTDYSCKPGCIVYSTNDFSQLEYGIRMLEAGARIKQSRCVVIAGNKRMQTKLADTGINLQYVPADTFINAYNTFSVNSDVIAMADEYIRQARDIRQATRDDVINGIKSYLVAGKILKDEKADAISMDCLGALADKDISLPCISWSRMNDEGIPAACEADTGAIASQIMVQYLFDRPGFQQDPVADTSDDTIIGAHCSCPTRLNGFSSPPEPFILMHHHGNRDAVPRTIWKPGQKITSLDFLPADGIKQKRSQLLISSGTVVDNMKVPPSGGCVVSVKVKFDRGHDVLSFPGFHQLFFYGDYVNELEDFCQLFNFESKIV